ncbi:MAG: type I polyketide synthase, partial [Acetobacteraceae bacterium]|nr:type I polyketide synthase [Acetobacteraceae bacterium]
MSGVAMEPAGDPAPAPDGIAIIGMACRLPRAPDIAALWRLLRSGEEGLTRFTAAELRAAGIPGDMLADPAYVPVNGALADVDLFDAGFFAMTPREAEITDPQHRLFLELAWEALEASGHEAPGGGESVGVYAGCGASTYLLGNLLPNRRALGDVGELRLRMGNGQEYLATRVSYKLNLRGPSVNVNTACSTSLVAVHLACDALASFQCDIALAGGISVQLPQVKGYRYEAGGILSPDGTCRAFDAAAAGTVSGNGGAIVVLRRLADALAAGDTVYAVIRGTAINNDGSEKAGYTAPSGNAQRRVIQEAHGVAGVDPGSIGYVEAHGTGTKLGDPIEFQALTEAFRSRTNRPQFCALGSLKTNFGHLDEAAGVAGLIKAALALHHREIPPSLHFEQPNPELAYESSPFYVNATLRPWSAPTGGAPRRAAVSSFGIGGTNAHAALEEAPAVALPPEQRPVQLLPVSAASVEACLRRQEQLARVLEDGGGTALADVAYTLQRGRRMFPYRATAVAAEAGEAGPRLRRASPRPARKDPPPVVFMFSGQGAQYPGMAAALYRAEREFRETIDCCAESLTGPLGLDLRDLIVAEDGAGCAASLRQTRLAQPALFAVEYALAQLWRAWGLQPSALIGHSLGEYTALCLAGVMDLETALAIVARRGELMQEAPSGAMLSVPLAPDALRQDLDGAAEIAAVNAPDRCTAAGPAEAIAALGARLRERGIETTSLAVSHAFHTRAMTAAAGALAATIAGRRLQAPRIPVISNLSGDWLADAGTPDYYARQLREPVQFAAGIARLLRELPDAVLLEVGPGSALVHAARRCGAGTCLPSLPPPEGGAAAHRTLLASLGRLWEEGVGVDWAAFAQAKRRRIALPTYPFSRTRHWIEPPWEAPAAPAPNLPGIEDRWCYRSIWRVLPVEAAPAPSGFWLLLADGDAEAGLAEILRSAGCRVGRARRGKAFAALGDDAFAVRPDSL